MELERWVMENVGMEGLLSGAEQVEVVFGVGPWHARREGGY